MEQDIILGLKARLFELDTTIEIAQDTIKTASIERKGVHNTLFVELGKRKMAAEVEAKMKAEMEAKMKEVPK